MGIGQNWVGKRFGGSRRGVSTYPTARRVANATSNALGAYRYLRGVKTDCHWDFLVQSCRSLSGSGGRLDHSRVRWLSSETQPPTRPTEASIL